MASSRRWALYATNYRLGTYREHRLAGARIWRVGVRLGLSVFTGWEAVVHAGRLSVRVALALPPHDARVRALLAHLSRERKGDQG